MIPYLFPHRSYNVAVPITPSDTVDLPRGPCDAIFGAGVVALVSQDGQVLNTTAGEVLPFQVVRVNATGTTATNLVALYYK